MPKGQSVLRPNYATQSGPEFIWRDGLLWLYGAIRSKEEAHDAIAFIQTMMRFLPGNESTFSFSISGTGPNPNFDEFAENLYSGGCDDSTVSFQGERFTVHFDREGLSRETAIASAVRAVLRAGGKIDALQDESE